LKKSRAAVSESICLACGLCCDGTIFGDVKLVPGDDAAALRAHGLRLLRPVSKKTVEGPGANPTLRFQQPCTALNGCQCRIYDSRPGHCRDFECFLLKKVEQRRVTRPQALRVIRAARTLSQKVRKLLRSLGDAEETAALADRFRRTSRRLERANPDEKGVELYRQLTLDFHNLNLLIHEAFYTERPKQLGTEPRL
jgi:Fe-S-cluster containining protein